MPKLLFWILTCLSLSNSSQAREICGDILKAGHPLLRMIAQPVDLEKITSPEIQAIIKIMTERMHETGSVGIAAPQVGVGLRIIQVEDEPKLAEQELYDKFQIPLVRIPLAIVINPVLELTQQEQSCHPEGCSSIPFYGALVPRYLQAKLRGYDQNGDAIERDLSGWEARLYQHEVDHLEGILYIDRMEPRTFSLSQI